MAKTQAKAAAPKATQAPAKGPQNFGEALADLLDAHTRYRQAWNDVFQFGEPHRVAAMEQARADLMARADVALFALKRELRT